MLKNRLILCIFMVSLLIGCSVYDEQDTSEEPDVTFVPIEEIKVEETSDDTMEESEDVTEVVVNSEDAIFVIVNETDLVRLTPDAFDPDDDTLFFVFSYPLDEEGEWQTSYGDEGEYTVTLTASDDEFSVTQDILIIVNKKEESPTIDVFDPQDLDVSVDEDSNLAFSIDASDLNNDDLVYEWSLDGEIVSDDDSFTYVTSYNDAGDHEVQVIVTDGTSATSMAWEVRVRNVNRLPVIEDISDIIVEETDTVMIDVESSDPDDDALVISISDPVGSDGEWDTGYDDAGEYFVTITADDGEDTVETQVRVVVQNVNRPPVILGVIQG